MSNCISYWFPRIENVVPVPKTLLVRTDCELVRVLYGEPCEGFEDFLRDLNAAVDSMGRPCFLRTGHTSAKHEWNRTCFLSKDADLREHVMQIAEYSEMVSFIGMPLDVWAVRELLKTEPVFTAFRGMPITKEFRFFVEGGKVTHIQPYWPKDSIQDPSVEDWEWRLERISELSEQDREALVSQSLEAAKCVEGDWSIDWLWTTDRGWVLTDMALAKESFRYDPASPEVEALEDFLKSEP